jgi:hypothetical protein
MPSPSTAKLPIPKSWDEFEDIISDMAKECFKDPLAVRYGRTGQGQDGVDIYGNSTKLKNFGIQCKNVSKLSNAEVEVEVKKAELFESPLAVFIIATTLSRDASLQKFVLNLSNIREKCGKFKVGILFWEDITLNLSEHPHLIQKHFPGFVSSNISIDKIEKVIINSTADEWNFTDEKGAYTYKSDVNLVIKRDDFEEDEEFNEEWATIGLHKGFTVHHSIYYGTSFIKKMFMVAVDGYRAYIPYPKSWRDLTITPFQYAFGRIINDSYKFPEFCGENYFDSYLRRLGIKVKDEKIAKF